jgi:UDPglucose 6-dehydrogenase
MIGTGYVGPVMGACLANLGNQVICIDKDKQRVVFLKKGAYLFSNRG